MSQVTRKEVPALVQSTAAPVPLEAGKGSKLTAGTTYIYVLSAADAPWESISFKWDSGIIVTLQFEETNLPRYFNDADEETADVSDTDVVAGNWIVWPLPTVAVSLIATDATTGNATYSSSTGLITVAGGTAGGGRMNLPDIGSRRGRVKAVVSGTGGYLRVGNHRKS